jgi:protein-tyrosine phosphatase
MGEHWLQSELILKTHACRTGGLFPIIKMIDIHSHILPGLDDGAKNLKQAVEMARVYAETGFRRVIATPHWIAGTSMMPSADSINKDLLILNTALKNNAIELTLFPGMEVGLDPDLPIFLDNDLIHPLAGKRHILIETPFQRFPMGWRGIFSEILTRRFSVIMAHPERCAQLAEKPEIFDDLLDAGVYLQVNWGSFLGHAGPEAREIACYLAEKGYIHCLATDSHDPENRHPGHIRAAAAVLVELAGIDNLKLLAGANPLRILRGEPLEPMVKGERATPPVQKKWWRFWE